MEDKKEKQPEKPKERKPRKKKEQLPEQPTFEIRRGQFVVEFK